MPNPLINKYAQETGKSEDEVEDLWKQAKKEAEEMGEGNNYAYTVGILKNLLDIKESFETTLTKMFISSEHDNFKKFIEETTMTSSDIPQDVRPDTHKKDDEEDTEKEKEFEKT